VKIKLDENLANREADLFRPGGTDRQFGQNQQEQCPCATGSGNERVHDGTRSAALGQYLQSCYDHFFERNTDGFGSVISAPSGNPHSLE
jgi:hypothetical protein